MEKTGDRVKLFSKVELLDTQKHANLGWNCLRDKCEVSCCKIPDRTSIVLDEIVRLSKYFPITFTIEVDKEGREERLICAHLRLKEDKKGCIYLVEGVGCSIERGKPYACKQYPFFIRGENIGIDLTCPGFSPSAEEKIILGEGINNYFEENFLWYSLKLEEQKKATSEFVKMLFDLGLIVGAKYVEDNYQVQFNMVDEERLIQLDKTTLDYFVRHGYLRYIYAHLNSLDNWSKLVNCFFI